MRLLAFSVLASALVCAAQPGSVGAPGLGFAYDSRSGAIRPIRGIPGAALLGDALPGDASAALTGAAISPRQDLALATAAGAPLRVIRLDGGGAMPIPGALAAPAHIAFSPSGHAALLTGSAIQIVTGLADSPAVRSLDSPALAATPVAAALSDDAQAVLLASGTDPGDPVWFLGSDGSALQLPLPGSIAAAAFRRDSRDAVAVARSGDVYLVRNAGPNAEIRQVYAGDDQTAGPTAIQFSADGTHAFTANSRGWITAIDLAAGSAAAVSCHCTPGTLEPLGGVTGGSALFRLTEISGSPMLLFDASGSEPRVWFVPPDPAGDAERSAQ